LCYSRKILIFRNFNDQEYYVRGSFLGICRSGYPTLNANLMLNCYPFSNYRLKSIEFYNLYSVNQFIDRTGVNYCLNYQYTFRIKLYKIDNSERIDECIDFTMIITSRNNASISNFGGGFRGKSDYPWCNIEVKNKHFPSIFKKIEKNKKQMTENGNFYAKPVFDRIDFFIWLIKNTTLSCPLVFLQVAIEKTRSIIIGKILSAFEFYIFTKSRNDNDLSSNDFKYFISRRYLKILPTTEIFNFYEKIFLAESKYLKMLHKWLKNYKNTYAQFFFLAFEVQILTKIRQNHEYLQIILLTNHFHSESFFVYNDTYHCIQI
ncbi:hypothetical protein AGLY_002192, partial [Aphis glycines]